MCKKAVGLYVFAHFEPQNDFVILLFSISLLKW